MAAFVLGLVTVLSTAAGVTRIPDCLYVAYGCEYYIWDVGGGRGEALVTCDGGGTFSAYAGRMGHCPNM